jgi:hypothetical protein
MSAETCDGCPPGHPHLSPFATQKIQEIILWRRPLAVVVTFAIAESMFFFVSVTDLSFLATVLFLHIVHILFRLVYSLAGRFIESVLFRAKYDDPPDLPNRIRSFDEVQALVHTAHEKGRAFVAWLRDYRAQPTIEKHALFFAPLFFLFVVSTVLGTFWVVFLIVHAVLIVPGVALNPTVRRLVAKKVAQFRDTAQKARDSAKAKTE